MPQYNYRALNPAGRNIRGQIAAANDLDLYQRLRDIGLELVDFRIARQRKAMLGSRVKNRDLVHLCLHLEQLSAAGVPLLDGLHDVRDSTPQGRLRDLLSEVAQDVAQGLPLSAAFGKHPRVFGAVFQSLIAAGEESGSLTESFQELVKHLRWTEAVGAKVRKAVRYPAFMLVVMLGVFMFMMTMVVPEVVGFLKSTGQELPALTLGLVATSGFVTQFWYAILLVPLLGVGGAAMLRQTSEPFAYKLDRLLLRLPTLGPLARKIALSRFAHFFAVMFRSGVPILTCLETAQKVVGNRFLAEQTGVVRQAVQDGNPLSQGMRDSGEFPGLVVRMVRIGEDSGNLGETLENVTTFYDQEVNDSVDTLIAMIEPALTIVAGGMLLWVVLAVIGPIYDSFGKLGI